MRATESSFPDVTDPCLLWWQACCSLSAWRCHQAARWLYEVLSLIWFLVVCHLKSYLVLDGNHVKLSHSMLFPFSTMNSLVFIQIKPQSWFPQSLAHIYKPQRTSQPTWLDWSLLYPHFIQPCFQTQQACNQLLRNPTASFQSCYMELWYWLFKKRSSKIIWWCK